MTFPNPLNIATATYTSGTTKTVTVASSPAAGDLLVIILCTQGSTSAITTPSGWDVRAAGSHSVAGSTNDGYMGFYIRESDGTETTVAFTTPSTTGTSIVFRIAAGNWYGDITYIEGNGLDAGQNNAADPPSETASWGAEDNLFVIAVGGPSAAPSALPTEYADNDTTCDGSTPTRRLRMGTRDLASATDNPGVCTSGKTSSWVFTVVIRPAAASHTEQGSWGAILIQL